MGASMLALGGFVGKDESADLALLLRFLGRL